MRESEGRGGKREEQGEERVRREGGEGRGESMEAGGMRGGGWKGNRAEFPWKAKPKKRVSSTTVSSTRCMAVHKMSQPSNNIRRKK